jgi:hypothetical protein
MRRTAPGYVQLPHNHHNAHPQAAGPRPGGPRSPAGGSPLARTSTTASYFEAGEDNGTAASAAQQNGTVGPSGKIVSPDSGGTTSRSSASPARPPNSRTKSNSSIHSVGSLRSAGSSYTASSSSPSGPVPSTATAASHHLPATAHKHYHHQHSNNIPQHQQHSYRYYPGHSPAGSSNSSKTTQADEIEASLRQWRNQLRHSSSSAFPTAILTVCTRSSPITRTASSPRSKLETTFLQVKRFQNATRYIH